MTQGRGGWDDSKLLARAILHDRPARRKWMGAMLAVAVMLMVLGLWVVDGLLLRNLAWFLVWWGGCAGLTFLVLLFAVYDALAVLREERERYR